MTDIPKKALANLEAGADPEMGASTSNNGSTTAPANLEVQNRRKPKKMTPRRKIILSTFLVEVCNHPTRYGYPGEDAWMEELIKRFDEHRPGLVTAHDISKWLTKAEFKDLYQRILTISTREVNDADDGFQSAENHSSPSPPLEKEDNKNAQQEVQERSESNNQQDFQLAESCTAVRHQQQDRMNAMSPSSDIMQFGSTPAVTMISGGFVIYLPPLTTSASTTLLVKPAIWTAEFISSGDTSSSDVANTTQLSFSDVKEAAGNPKREVDEEEGDESCFHSFQEQPYDYSPQIKLEPATSMDYSGNFANADRNADSDDNEQNNNLDE